MKYHLLALYLTYLNDWLSIENMASAYELTPEELQSMIDAGRRFHQENVTRWELTGLDYFAGYVTRNDINEYKRFL